MLVPALPVDLVELVPHRGPMLLMEQLDVYTDDVGEAVGVVADDHLFRRADHSLHPAVLVEMLAQGAAAHEGYRRILGGEGIGGGLLAGIRDFTLGRPPRCGERVRSVATRDMVLGSLQMVTGRIECDGELLGAGNLVFFLSDQSVPAEVSAGVGAAASAAAARRARCSAGGLLQALADARTRLDRAAGSAWFRFDADFPAFEGHFPALAILPAVVSVVCAEQTVSALAGEEMVLRGVRSAKFSHPIMPGATVEVRCERLDGVESGRWKVHIHAADEVVARLDLRLGRDR